MSFLLFPQEGMTALSWAFEVGHVNIVRMLQAAGVQHEGYGKKQASVIIGTVSSREKLRCMAAENGFIQVENCLAVVRYLHKLFQPSYTVFTQITPLLLPKAS